MWPCGPGLTAVHGFWSESLLLYKGFVIIFGALGHLGGGREDCHSLQTSPILLTTTFDQRPQV